MTKSRKPTGDDSVEVDGLTPQEWRWRSEALDFVGYAEKDSPEQETAWRVVWALDRLREERLKNG